MKMPQNQFRKALFLFSFLVASLLFDHIFALAQAQILSGAVSSAMGGAGRAGAEVTQIIFLNPAVAAVGSGMSSGFFYSDGYKSQGNHETNFGVSLVENSAEVFAAGGFAYVQRRRLIDGQLSVNEKFIHGALAQFIAPNLSFGVSFYNLSQEVVGGEHYTQWNGSVGLLYLWDSGLGFALVMGNFAQPADKIPDRLKMLTNQSAGVQYLVPNLMRVAFDITRRDRFNPEHGVVYQAGCEILSAPLMVFRLGTMIDDIEKRNYATLGLGFTGPRLKISYGFVKPTRGANEAMHSVDMDIPF